MYYLDWRDGKLYDYTIEHTPRMWAWEFIRRNPKYWQHWSDLLDKKKKSHAKMVQWHDNLDSKPFGGSMRNVVSYAPATDPDSYGDFVTSFEDPRLDIRSESDHELWGFSSFYSPSSDTPHFFFEAAVIRIYSPKLAYDGKGYNEAFLSGHDRRVFIGFSLLDKIAPQLKMAEAELNKRQGKKHKLEKVKLRAEALKTYLRLIDANNLHVPRTQSASVLFPDVDLQLARDNYSNGLKRAKKIMNSEYRKWL